MLFVAFVDPHWAVTVSVFEAVVSKRVFSTPPKSAPSMSNPEEENENIPFAAMEATPAAPMALIVNCTCRDQNLPDSAGRDTVPVSASNTEPDFILILTVSPFADEITPPTETPKLSPTAKPFAGTVRVPTPVEITEVSVIVPVIGVLEVVCAKIPP